MISPPQSSATHLHTIGTWIHWLKMSGLGKSLSIKWGQPNSLMGGETHTHTHNQLMAQSYVSSPSTTLMECVLHVMAVMGAIRWPAKLSKKVTFFKYKKVTVFLTSLFTNGLLTCTPAILLVLLWRDEADWSRPGKSERISLWLLWKSTPHPPIHPTLSHLLLNQGVQTPVLGLNATLGKTPLSECWQIKSLI